MRRAALRAARSQLHKWHAGERQRDHRDRPASRRRDRDGRDDARVHRRDGAMIVDRRQIPWATGTAIGALAGLIVYVAYAAMSVNGARGGSMMGLFFAALGTGAIVFECLLGLRKRYPASRLGRVKTWVSAHVWLGLASFLLILMH